MARYVNDLNPGKPASSAVEDVEAYLRKEGFARTHGTTWKKGLGLMLGPQFVSVEPRGESVHLEAWIQYALLPGVYIGEMGIEGWFGVIPKRKLKGRVEAIEKLVGG